MTKAEIYVKFCYDEFHKTISIFQNKLPEMLIFVTLLLYHAVDVWALLHKCYTQFVFQALFFFHSPTLM